MSPNNGHQQTHTLKHHVSNERSVIVSMQVLHPYMRMYVCVHSLTHEKRVHTHTHVHAQKRVLPHGRSACPCGRAQKSVLNHGWSADPQPMFPRTCRQFQTWRFLQTHTRVDVFFLTRYHAVCGEGKEGKGRERGGRGGVKAVSLVMMPLAVVENGRIGTELCACMHTSSRSPSPPPPKKKVVGCTSSHQRR